jgi:hypothetical protein
MSELDEAIQESIEKASESKLNSRVAIFVAITATFMAICNIKGGNIVQNMAKMESRSVDTWNYFQAKSTKQSVAENTLVLLKANPNASKEVITKFEEKIKKYDSEKEEIKKEALSYEKSYDDLNVYDDQFDMTEAFLSIAIAMYGLTALTQKKFLFYFALSLSSLGLLLGVTAFLKIPLHSDFISTILG